MVAIVALFGGIDFRGFSALRRDKFICNSAVRRKEAFVKRKLYSGGGNLLGDAPQFLKDFIFYSRAIQGKSETTVSEYFYDMQTFLRYLKCKLKGIAVDGDFSNLDISDVKPEDLKAVDLHFLFEYLYYTAEARQNEASTRARKASSLRSFFNHAVKRAKILEENPAADLELPKIPQKLPVHLTLEESFSVLASVDGEYAKRNFAILTLFLNCGLRLAELCAINVDDYKQDRLVITGKGNKQRVVYLNQACKSALDSYMAVRPVESKDKNAMFLSRLRRRISREMVQLMVKKTFSKAGLDVTKYSVHKLRHTAATLLYKHGNVDVLALKEILGHKHLSTTQIYTHLDEQALKSAMDSSPLSRISKETAEESETT